ncbi:MAG TPA: glycosyltransferase family 4 protein [Thermoanaerobaculia bacterium]|nr:glycosyltransferase family 4 protein [Thermoanaerobaculia bacterium]
MTTASVDVAAPAVTGRLSGARIAILTTRFFDARSISINYYIAGMVAAMADHHIQSRPRILSLDALDERTRPIRDVFMDHGFPPTAAEADSLTVLDSAAIADALDEADLIVTTFYDWGDHVAAARRRRDVPVVYWVPSILLHEYVVGGRYRWSDSGASARRQRALIRSADLLIFNSQMDRELASRYFPGVAAKSCAIHPVPAYRLPCANDAAQRTITYAGRWDPRKGIDALVDCVFQLYAADRTIRLRVLTDAPTVSGAAAMLPNVTARKLELLTGAGAVELVPWMGRRSAYLEELCRSGVLLAPSLYDPFNIVAFDAVTLGVPSIISTFCGVTEVLRESATVRFLNPLDVDDWYATAQELLRGTRGAGNPVAANRRSAEETHRTLEAWAGLM